MQQRALIINGSYTEVHVNSPPNIKKESVFAKYPPTCPDLGLKEEDFLESVCHELRFSFGAVGREQDSPAKP